MVQKIPKFPITCKSKEGQSFKALFKPTGNPKLLKVFLTYKSKTVPVNSPMPNGEVLSWGVVALQAFETAFPLPETNVLFEPPKAAPIVPAKLARPEQLYKTVQSADPTRHYLCRFVGYATNGKGYVIQVHYPSLHEWKEVIVQPDYKLQEYQGEREMPTKKPPKPTKAVPASINAPQAHTANGLGVYEAWGKAFAAFAAKPDAPKLITGFMEKQFPGRKTKWARWVNNVRCLYNNGKLPGTPAPQSKIQPYKQ